MVGGRDRERGTEDRVRERFVTLVINMSIGRIPGSLETNNPLMQNIIINEQLR